MKDLCYYCENLLPEYEYSYSDEGDKTSIIGYSCFYDFDIFSGHCDTDIECMECVLKCCICFEYDPEYECKEL